MVDSAEVRRSSGWNVCLSPHRRREPKVLEGSTRIIRRGKSHYLVHCDGGIVDNSVDNVFVDQSHYVGLSIEAVLDDRSGCWDFLVFILVFAPLWFFVNRELGKLNRRCLS
jgi:hypothetical protein